MIVNQDLFTKINPEIVKQVMDVHAKNIAIAFAEWINREQANNYLKGDEGYGWYYDKPLKVGVDHELIGNTTDLYTLFLSKFLLNEPGITGRSV